jgi:thiol-disulfide isomerase/thioredoxin
MLVALVAAAGGWWFMGSGGAAPPGMPKYQALDPAQPAPDLAFTDAQGRPLTLKDFRGRVVLLNLWATWCAPCIEEMPSLDKLQARLGGPEFEVLALSLDRGGWNQVEPFARKLGLRHLSYYLDPPSSAMGALKPRGLPTTYLIDRDGRMVGKLEGAADWSSPAAQRLIEHYLRDTRGGVVRTGG